MEALVFLKSSKDEPYTTSDIIAEATGNNYRSVQRIIEKQKNRLEVFGRVRFEITPFETKGGVQNKKIYYLNEQQATLLITFLKNTEVVADFKTELVRQFFEMRQELQSRRNLRTERKPIRLSMTDAIKALPESPHKVFKYKQYTDLAYKVAIGKSAQKIRKERGAKQSDNASDFLTAKELQAVSDVENKISVLIQLGMNYNEIKSLLFRKENQQ